MKALPFRLAIAASSHLASYPTAVRRRCFGQGPRTAYGDDDVVAQVTAGPYSETQRMELRALIRLASEIIAYYWPDADLCASQPPPWPGSPPFDEAVGRAQQLLGGKGYLASEIFRDYVRSGRILPRHLDLVLRPLRAGPVGETGSSAQSPIWKCCAPASLTRSIRRRTRCSTSSSRAIRTGTAITALADRLSFEFRGAGHRKKHG